jgi:hypothetical protein
VESESFGASARPAARRLVAEIASADGDGTAGSGVQRADAAPWRLRAPEKALASSLVLLVASSLALEKEAALSCGQRGTGADVAPRLWKVSEKTAVSGLMLPATCRLALEMGAALFSLGKAN